MDNKQIVYKCLEPRGNVCEIEFSPPNERLDDLSNKTVYFLDNCKPAGELILKTTMKLMEKSFPGITCVYHPKKENYRYPESEEWWQEVQNNADAVVAAIGD